MIQAGRIVAFVVVASCFLLYTFMTVRDYTAPVMKRVKKLISRTKPAEASPTREPNTPITQYEEFKPQELKPRNTTEVS